MPDVTNESQTEALADAAWERFKILHADIHQDFKTLMPESYGYAELAYKIGFTHGLTFFADATGGDDDVEES